MQSFKYEHQQPVEIGKKYQQIKNTLRLDVSINITMIYVSLKTYFRKIT